MPNDEWRTPQNIYRKIQREMNIEFTLDPCTHEDNPLDTPKFFTKNTNGLTKSWKGEKAFVNPPYSRDNIGVWIKKCREEAYSNYETVVVGLLPLRTAQWFMENILPYAKIIRHLSEWRTLNHGECGLHFWGKRIRFINPETGAKEKQSPTWDTIIVVWV